MEHHFEQTMARARARAAIMARAADELAELADRARSPRGDADTSRAAETDAARCRRRLLDDLALDLALDLDG